MALTPSELRRRKMNLLMAMSYAAFASTKASTWSPTLLFANGEQGAWYDPSDFSTMFQDSAGTTPVTAVEQPVGLLLDKSKGLALGSEIASTFTVTTDWTFGSGTLTGLGTAGGGTATSVSPSVAGTWYKITYTKTGTSGLFQVRIGNVFVVTDGGAGAASRTYYALAANTAGLVFTNTGSYAGTVTGISCVSVAGNHASQSTAASRPVLSARVNLLAYSEQFDNAAWSKAGGSITSTGVTDPLGGSTADEFTSSGVNGYVALATAVTVNTNTDHTFAVWLKVPSGTNSVQIGIVTAGLSNIQSTTVTVTTEWQRFSISGSTGANASAKVIIGGGTTLGTGEVVYLWGADLRVTNVGVNLPAYQRVAAATDYDTSGFPLYLKFDGVDDSLATGSIDFSSTDKMSVFAGVRKLSDAASALFAELSATISSNAGSFYFAAPELTGVQGDFSFKSRGSIIPASVAQTATSLAPITGVLTGLGDISGDIARIRLNGVQVNYSADQGTGNYGNYPLYIGRRNNASFPYNGNLYSLIIRGALSTDAQIASTETYVNNLTKAY